MSERLIDYPGFIKLVIEVLESASVDYMIGGAVAVWAWGEPRGTMDLDLVADIPLDRVGELSRELEKWNMLVPADIMLNTILEDRADAPIQAIHIQRDLKPFCIPCKSRMNYAALRLSAGSRLIWDLNWELCTCIHRRTSS